MKTKLLQLSIALATAFMFLACEKTQTPDSNPTNNDSIDTPDPDDDDSNGPSGGALEPECCLLLVKFTDDKYREQIIAETHGNDSPRYEMRGIYPPVVEELIVGSNPWADKLPNGYWIANWRWGSLLIYPPTSALLPDKWESLTHWKQTWNEPAVKVPFYDYIEEVGYVARRDIDKYFSISTANCRGFSDTAYLLYKNPWVHARHYVSEKDIPEQDRELYFKVIHEQDSVHPIFVQRLMEITKNGDFEKLFINVKSLSGHNN